MTRAQRLLALIQLLRNHRYPVTGAALADELGISLRTLYRDIAILQAQGADIQGEAGLGYVLKPGFMLPPLMFSEDEIEALTLGVRWVTKSPDLQLAKAASHALQKIAAVLPKDLRNTLDASALLIGATAQQPESIDLSQFRLAIRQESKLEISYQDLKGAASQRTIWPFALGFFDQVYVLAAWCETRQAYRHFRIDRIIAMSNTLQRYPRRRQALFKEWRALEKIPV